MTALDIVWDQLQRVRRLTFIASSGTPTGWNGRGEGEVLVQSEVPDQLTFTEAGAWRPAGGKELRFHNVFRWSVVGDNLRLEHLRFGVDNPVHLFDLAHVEEGEWRSISPHLCRDDCYAAILLLHEEHIVLRWTINGPKKQERIEYVYS